MGFEETEKAQIEKDIELLTEEFMALCDEIRSAPEYEKLRLEYRKESKKKQILAKEERLNSLGHNWQENLRQIDFDRAQEIYRKIIDQLKYRDRGGAAIFLLQDTLTYKGDYCADRIYLELKNSRLTGNEIRLEIIKEEPVNNEIFLRKLREKLDVDPPAGGWDSGLNEVIRKLCESQRTGFICLRFSFAEDLENRPDFLSWLLHTFWKELVEILGEVNKNDFKVKILMTIVAEKKLHEASYKQEWLCSCENFDQKKILPLWCEHWDKRVIRVWLENCTGEFLKNSEGLGMKIAELPESIFQLSQGLPCDVVFHLREKMKELIDTPLGA